MQNGASFGPFLAIEGYGSMNMVSAVAYARAIAGREESVSRNSTTEDGRSAPSGAHLDTHRYRSGRRCAPTSLACTLTLKVTQFYMAKGG